MNDSLFGMIGWMLIVIPLSINSAYGGTYTFNTTAPQDKGLTFILTKTNTERVANGLTPYADIQAMLAGVLTDAFRSYVQQQRVEQAAAACAAYNAASAATRTQIDTALGGVSPCP